ncbi:MAG: altronate dehydratase [Clostridia bacterium]|nr:altronate dehydratase [Clostridia bacterium]
MLKIHEKDNVLVDVTSGHKYAACAIKAGEKVIKYGFPIGVATADIAEGEHVHSHNVKTGLEGKLEYTYAPEFEVKKTDTPTFMGYLRQNGEAAIRNELWIIPTVGCINGAAEKIAEKARNFFEDTYAFVHPYGCSQLGGDHETTQKVLASLCRHPNAFGVLVLGLGCENNHLGEFTKVLGDTEGTNIRFLNAQDSKDEIAEGVEILRALAEEAKKQKREPIPVSKLKIGLKCGGSDGLSGVTANPLVGRFCDRFTAENGIAVLSEVPEMFGAETILMNRCVDEHIFEKTVHMINRYKDYFIAYGQPIYENPSPGNKAGGITTLEEKSLGCVQKGGSAPVVDALDIAEPAVKCGLNLLYGPGNDMVAVTNLIASGCHMVLFTTGRGTPFAGVCPTVKISTNTPLAEKKANWIDYNAGALLDGKDLDADFYNYIISVAEGKKTRNEENGYREIAIFKNGVTL